MKRFPARALPLLLALAALPPAACGTPPAAPLRARFDAGLERARDRLVAARRDLHRHPELSEREERTAGIVARRLRELGFSVRAGVGGHGVVARLRGGRPGPVVAFRADMDAVASTEPDPVEFASTVPGVRHICGHDLHTTIGLALAEGFAAVRADLPGTVLLVFQPAEENVRGARAMIAAGALRDPKPVAMYAVHTAPLEVGSIGTIPGALLAGRDRATLALTAPDGLAEAARDAERMLRGLATVAEDATSARGDFVAVRIQRSGADPAGGWTIEAALTTATAVARAKVQRDLRAGLDSLRARGVAFALDYRERVAPGAVNDPGLERAARAPLATVVGDAGVVVLRSIPTAFSEDFGFFQDETPGVMFFLGVSNAAKGWVGLPHSPGYVADEEAIFVGARAMAAVMLDRLARPAR